VTTLSDRFVAGPGLRLRRRLAGDVMATAKRTRRHVERQRRRPRRHRPPRLVRRRVRIEQAELHGWPVYEAIPRRTTARARVVYLHGGSYVNEITSWHWSLVGRLARRVPARVAVPIYPLAPTAPPSEVVATGARVVADIADRGGPGGLTLAGDSAGGGLALAIALALRDQGLAMPDRLILIAPWLDLSLSDPQQGVLEPRDAMLRLAGMAEAGRIYAGDLPLDDPRVSPINGELTGLPPITVFAGTHDLLHPDSVRLAERGAADGVEVDLREAEGAPHVYPLHPTSQGSAARRALVELCREPDLAELRITSP
jgi:acetyl esterase/lipase